MSPLAAESAPVTHPTIGPFNYDTLLSSALAMAITLAVGFAVAFRLRRGRPGKLQMIFESFLSFVRGLVGETVDEGATFVIPLAATIGFYILVANWLAFLPLPAPLRPPSADLNQTLAMGVVVFLIVQWYALRVRGFRGYLSYFARPHELHWLARYPWFVLLNIIEEFVKPFTLALRLFGNLFAGLIMVWLLAQLGIFFGWIPIVPWKAFDVFFIGTLQAFIFMLLTVIYFGMVREGLEEGHGQAAAASSA